MKKLCLTALIASLLLIPFGTTALALPEETAAPIPVQEYLPGRVPAQTDAAEAMSPALHALVLALMNQEMDTFDFGDRELVWEGLYNMLSLYGQMDSRSEVVEDALLFPAETAADYAAALNASLEDLGPLPAALQDRLTSPSAGTYRVVCGEDGLSQLQVQNCQTAAGELQLTGALVYLADGTALATFQATLQLRDNMLGYAVTGLSLTVG